MSLKGKMEMIFWMENLQLPHSMLIIEFHPGEGKPNLTRRKTAQESRSSKNIQEDESSFKKHFQGMNEKDKRKSRSPLSRLTLWGFEEFLVTTVV